MSRNHAAAARHLPGARMAPSASLIIALAACTPAPSGDAPVGEAAGRRVGGVARVGTASTSAYVELAADGAPAAIGVVFSPDFFDQLPAEATDGKRCFDRDESGTVEIPDECNMWHEWVLELPEEITARDDIPFKWSLLNWNPMGHIPPGVYDSPHFDVHFYIAPVEEVMAIEPGPCGPEFVRCDQFEVATMPVPPNYMAADYQNVEAVAPAMGNHLIDTTSPEFQGEPFTRTWIYGVYGGEVTYYEEMVTLDFLRDAASGCYAIKSPPAVGLAGYYPTQSCLRYHADSGEYTVSMEGFVYREASPADPMPAEAEAEVGAED